MQVSVAQLKAQLSAYLSQVKRGEEVLITDHGKPVARIVPYHPRSGEQAAWLARLAADGRISLPKQPLAAEFLERLARGPRARTARSVVEALLEEREQPDR